MEELEFDRSLGINTVGTLELLNQSVHYNRYEATPYIALEELFGHYDLQKGDCLVDFGCGKGRVSFYIHNRFQSQATGIEMNGRLYQDAMKNLENYTKRKKLKGSISFERCYAQEYDIQSGENRFYFFNPFSIQIFMKVVDNILQSVNRHKRTVDLILYYPTSEYIQFIENRTTFEFLDEVKIPGLYEQNDNERFLIFRLDLME